jgi:hypothetical protein
LSIIRADVCGGILKKIADEYKNIHIFIKNINDSMFDIETRALIYKYIIFYVFCQYITLIPSNVNVKLRKDAAQNAANPLPDISVQEEINEKIFDAFAGRDDDPTLGGNMEQLNDMICKVLFKYAEVFSENKNKINRTFEDIYSGALNVKYREKEEMKKYFENMTQEERDVEKVLMMHKMGKWNEGTKKTVYTYDKQKFDEEQAVIERLAATDSIYGDAAQDATGEDDLDNQEFIRGANGEKTRLYEADVEDDYRADYGDNMYRDNMDISDVGADGEEGDDNLDDENIQYYED